MEPAEIPVPDDFKQKKKRMIIVAIVVVVLTVVAYAGTFSYSAKTVNVMTVDMTVKYSGTSNGYFGPSLQHLTANYDTLYGGENFSYAITFTNQGNSAHTIQSITSNTAGFSIVSMSGNLPLTIQPGASQKVILLIHLPDYNFSGPLNITVSAS